MSLASETTMFMGDRHIRGDEVRTIICSKIGVHIFFKDDSKVIAFTPDVLNPLNYCYANSEDENDDDIIDRKWPLTE